MRHHHRSREYANVGVPHYRLHDVNVAVFLEPAIWDAPFFAFQVVDRTAKLRKCHYHWICDLTNLRFVTAKKVTQVS